MVALKGTVVLWMMSEGDATRSQSIPIAVKVEGNFTKPAQEATVPKAVEQFAGPSEEF